MPGELRSPLVKPARVALEGYRVQLCVYRCLLLVILMSNGHLAHFLYELVKLNIVQITEYTGLMISMYQNDSVIT